MYPESTISDEDRQPARAGAPPFAAENKCNTLVKFGGNAMTSQALTGAVLEQIAAAHSKGNRIVLVHGGGPFIARLLDEAGVESRFIKGHRVTDEQAIRYVSMALCGKVNGEIVAGLSRAGVRAVGINGRDSGMVRAVRREASGNTDGDNTATDLGYVGDVAQVDPQLISDLLECGYLPVVAPISTGPDGCDYNINADMFAGHLAAALMADSYIVLTDVDGLYRDRDDHASTIQELTVQEAEELLNSVITGGMIPKLQSCLVAVAGGVKAARIINGTKPEVLKAVLGGTDSGTTIRE